MNIKTTIGGFVVACVAVLWGCGGIAPGGVGDRFDISPTSIRLVPGGHQVMEASFLEAPPSIVEWTIDEQNGGAIVPDNSHPALSAIYTAPATPGVYHVRAVAALPTRAVTRRATIIVEQTP